MQTTRAVTSFSPRQALEYANSNAIIIDIIPRGSLIIIADSVGMQSKEVARFLMEQGYEEVACLAGGMVQWDRDGLPLSKDTDYEMVGGCACRLHPQK